FQASRSSVVLREASESFTRDNSLTGGSKACTTYAPLRLLKRSSSGCGLRLRRSHHQKGCEGDNRETACRVERVPVIAERIKDASANQRADDPRSTPCGKQHPVIESKPSRSIQVCCRGRKHRQLRAVAPVNTRHEQKEQHWFLAPGEERRHRQRRR